MRGPTCRAPRLDSPAAVDGSYFWINFAAGRPALESHDSTGAYIGAGGPDLDVDDDAWHHVGFVLVEVAPAIGVALDNRGALSDADAEGLAAETEDATPYWRERIVWLTLYEAARCSIANTSLIVFH